MSRKRKPNYFIPVAVVAGIGLAIYTSSKPWMVYQQEKAKANDMRGELESTQKADAKLKAKEQLLNPVQKEEEARRMGYVLPNETPLPDKNTKAPVSKETKSVASKNDAAKQPIDLRDEDHNGPIAGQ
jgi:hypothetical protein